VGYLKHCIFILTAILCLSCKKAEQHSNSVFFAMGTVVSITAPNAASAVTDEVKDYITELSDRISAECTLISGTPERVEISEDTYKLFQLAEEYRQKSEGRFNVGIFTVSSLYGFPEGPYHEADPDLLKEALALATEKSVKLYAEEGRFYAEGGGLKVDLGAFAKGWIVDRGAELFHKQGVNNFIINAGGDLYASGEKADRAWHLGVTDPAGLEPHIGVVSLSDKALATSGIYERYFIAQDGRHISHLFNGATGEAADKYQSVSVIADTAELADLYSTLYFFMDVAEIADACKEQNTAVMAVDRDGKQAYFCDWQSYAVK
jgi:thiamine biosynthesis lipoprotein